MELSGGRERLDKGSTVPFWHRPLLRLVLAPGIYRLPSRDWFSRRVYTASPPAIGSRAGYIPPPLPRLALPTWKTSWRFRSVRVDSATVAI
eukprot:1192615-Prorocentrum_minimum.AAC.4